MNKQSCGREGKGREAKGRKGKVTCSSPVGGKSLYKSIMFSFSAKNREGEFEVEMEIVGKRDGR